MCCLHVRTVKNFVEKTGICGCKGTWKMYMYVPTRCLGTCSYLVEVSDLGSFLAHFLLVREDELLR